MKTDTNRGYCTSEEETTCESKKVAWFTFWDNDFADKVELDLRGRELIQENGKWFVVKKNVNDNEHNSIDRNVNDICDDILINQVADVCDDEVELNLGNYEIEIRDNKTYAVLKKIEYPKTYEECCDILGIDVSRDIEHTEHLPLYKDINQYDVDLLGCLIQFRKLLICRDAYCKIAGEEMELGKYWEPDWKNIEQDKYVIYTDNNTICFNCFVFGSAVLAFPTEEIRDAFDDNFKELIEKCKELL